ncbi:hypothetical protein M404DRAFT_995571 [Pisolithus tinctorius Marx 270]|uniref:Uncharacterized protein n=1 Tax=Pisolithus tinctorius Marx 270 TaxID=870435 RepID=A0A0C3KLB9_PISTI|nr:hypothetical protein M404DRAFT_995571 [Pisolithus tinctorius Marx 270]
MGIGMLTPPARLAWDPPYTPTTQLTQYAENAMGADTLMLLRVELKGRYKCCVVCSGAIQ